MTSLDSPNPIDNLSGTGDTVTVPGLGRCSSLSLGISKWTESKKRLFEAKTVNPSNYSDLEYCFNEAYREMKNNLSKISYAIAMAKQNIEDIKADIILDEIPKIMEEKGLRKSSNNADLRNAVFARSEKYREANEHLANLQALEMFFEGHIKLMENTCRYMRKRMDYIIRSGAPSIGVT